MRNVASLPADRFDELLRRLPGGLDLDLLARQSKAIQRKRELTSGPHLLRLALARGPGGLSLSQAAAWATMLGLAKMSDPAVKKRLDKAVTFLDAVMAGLLADKAPGAALRWAGRILRNADGSCFRIGDRNFARAASLHRFRQQSANRADFIVRVGWNAFSLTRSNGCDFDLITHLGTLPADMTPHEVMLRARLGPLDRR